MSRAPAISDMFISDPYRQKRLLKLDSDWFKSLNFLFEEEFKLKRNPCVENVQYLGSTV